MDNRLEKADYYQLDCEACAPPIIESAAAPPCCPPLSVGQDAAESPLPASLNAPMPVLGLGLVGVLLLAKQIRLLRRDR